jgi:hypothetical protein
MVSQAHAGSLSLLVTASDGVSVLITGGPFGTVTNNGNTLTVTNIAALNLFLGMNGNAVQFNGLQASSSFAPTSGSAVGAFVTQSGVSLLRHDDRWQWYRHGAGAPERVAASERNNGND